MEKLDYVVTKLAGREVAGLKSPGKGSTISLTALQAEHPLRLGHIELPKADEPEDEGMSVQQPHDPVVEGPVVQEPEETPAPEKVKKGK